MQFAALRYFIETARLGSIRRASEVLYVAPSAISRQIAQLEQTFGSPLLERHALGVRLTAAGEVFLTQARLTIKDFERLRADLDDLQQLRRGHIKIATMEGAVQGLLYGTIRDFEKQYPGITYEIVIGGTETQIGALVREECEISVAFNAPPHQEVAVECSIREPVCVIMHPDHPLANKRSLQLTDLAEQRVAVLAPTFKVRTLLDTALASEGIAIKPTLTINHIGHAIAFAQANMGVSFAGHHIVQRQVMAGLLKAIPLKHAVFEDSVISLCRHRSRKLTRPAQAFLGVLRKYFLAIDGRRRCL